MARQSLRIPFLLLLLIPACGDPTSPGDRIPGPLPGEIAVTINVSGDVTANSSLYGIFVNNSFSSYAALGGTTRWPAAKGDYVIAVRPVNSDTQWCAVAGTAQMNVQVTSEQTSAVSFSLECPSLEGTTTLSIAPFASGLAAPAIVHYNIKRLNGPPLSLSADVRVGERQDVVVSPGLYTVSLVVPGGCNLPLTGFAESLRRLLGIIPKQTTSTYPTIVARAGLTAQVTTRLTCQ